MTRTPERTARIEEVLRQRQPGLTAIMENIWDPHNVAAIMRSCDATGVLDLHLLYYIEPFPDLQKKGKSSSAGARKWLRLHYHESVEQCFSALRKEGFRIYVSRLDPGATPLHDLDMTGPTALVLGNEQRGVSEEAAALADAAYTIPMCGMVESLNVSVAAAVSLYEGFRQRREAGLLARPQLPEEQRKALMEEWLRK